MESKRVSVGRLGIVLFGALQGVWLSLLACCSLDVLLALSFGSTADYPRLYPLVVAAMFAAIAIAVTLILNIKYFPREEKVLFAVPIEIGTALVTFLCMLFVWSGIFRLLQQIF